MTLIFFLLGLIVVFYLMAKVCDEYFVASLDSIAKKLKLSDDVAGATLMAVGSSAPEFFTSLIAILSGSKDVGAGTIVGSAIFNILVIVGGSVIVAKTVLSWKPVVRDMLFYSLSIIILFLTFQDGRITIAESVIYILLYAVYVFILSQWSGWFPSKNKEDLLEEISEQTEQTSDKSEKIPVLGGLLNSLNSLLDLTFPKPEKREASMWTVFWISLVWIVALSWALVELGIGLAQTLGIPEVIIGLTILAAGTSVPDLISSLIVAKKGRGDMAVSNAAGSNIFDILICLGFPWALVILLQGKDVVVANENLSASIILLFFTVVVILFLFALQKFRVGPRSGYFLIGLYLLYLSYQIYLAYGGNFPLPIVT